MKPLIRLNEVFARLLAPLADPAVLAARWYVSWQFFKSGLLKLQDWDTTLYLFQNEYHVPLLPPTVAAYAGAFGEVAFPILLALGLVGRFGAVGLFAVNAMAVVSYAHVLLKPGFEAAIGQHVLWGALLIAIAIHGPGRLSADYWLARRTTPPGRY